MMKCLGEWVLVLVGLGLGWIGFVNLFWGNDPFFGLGIVLASGLYVLPGASRLYAAVEGKRFFAFLTVLFVLIIWAALGVGELEDKVMMMQASFPMPNISGI